MPEANQYSFSNRELLELLIKKAGVHEGKWVLMATFGFGAANFGPTPDKMAPGAFTVINNIGIQRATAESPEEMTADASVINPSPSPNAKRPPSSRSRRVASSTD